MKENIYLLYIVSRESVKLHQLCGGASLECRHMYKDEEISMSLCKNGHPLKHYFIIYFYSYYLIYEPTLNRVYITLMVDVIIIISHKRFLHNPISPPIFEMNPSSLVFKADLEIITPLSNKSLNPIASYFVFLVPNLFTR